MPDPENPKSQNPAEDAPHIPITPEHEEDDQEDAGGLPIDKRIGRGAGTREKSTQKAHGGVTEKKGWGRFSRSGSPRTQSFVVSASASAAPNSPSSSPRPASSNGGWGFFNEVQSPSGAYGSAIGLSESGSEGFVTPMTSPPAPHPKQLQRAAAVVPGSALGEELLKSTRVPTIALPK